MVHVSIKGVPILGNVKIIQNTGVKRENTLNFIKGQLTTGKNYHIPQKDLSYVFKFESILSRDDIKTYRPIYYKLRDYTKNNIANITIGELTFNGKITSLDEELTVGGERKYTWVVEGSENFKPGIKNFNTFNYKKQQ